MSSCGLSCCLAPPPSCLEWSPEALGTSTAVYPTFGKGWGEAGGAQLCRDPGSSLWVFIMVPCGAQVPVGGDLGTHVS